MRSYLTDDDLPKLDARFTGGLPERLRQKLIDARNNPHGLSESTYSELFLSLAPLLEDFIAREFGIEGEINALRERHHADRVVFYVKREFVQRFAVRKYPEAAADAPTDAPILPEPIAYTSAHAGELEAHFACSVQEWLRDPLAHQEDLEQAARYAAWAVLTQAGRERHGHGVLFKVPAKTLLPLTPDHVTHRPGFDLTDPGYDHIHALDQAVYCIKCHPQVKDSCRTGLKTTSAVHTVETSHDMKAGCPLDQKISQMHILKQEGMAVAALAVIMIDNPMVAATGHRICNDCIRSCIFQKQEAVNTPAVETQILKSVLELPWGLEIYDLLSRWNPLKLTGYLPVPRGEHTRRVLITGAGPAGFALAHYLTQQGHEAVICEGLTVTPLPYDIRDTIKDIRTISQDLSERAAMGFGGVMEYGITVRWDKNLLDVIRIILCRRAGIRLIGGVYFPGTVSAAQAFETLGVDHIALASGAGSPKALDLKPLVMPEGMRFASDFLMSLHNGNAWHKDSRTSLTVDLPAVVIGAGLTAIDTATEVLAYYQAQLAKYAGERDNAPDEAARQERLSKLPERERRRYDLWRQRYLELRNSDDPLTLLRKWGGVTIVYRKKLEDAPAVRTNAQEVTHALQEGITIIDEAVPLEVLSDGEWAVTGLKVLRHGREQVIPAASVFIAAGISKNPHHHLHGEGISHIGDLDPMYSGSVVKALASAKAMAVKLETELVRTPLRGHRPSLDEVEAMLTARIKSVRPLMPNVLEVIVHAPMPAANFRPGQFFRLQNITSDIGHRMESVAVTGAWADAAQGEVGLLIWEAGASTKLCRELTPGEQVVLMGPTGQPAPLPHNARVLLIAQGALAAAVMRPQAQALRSQGCAVICLIAGGDGQPLIYEQEIRAAADEVAHEVAFCAYDLSDLKGQLTRLHDTRDFTHIYITGSAKMMAAASELCHDLRRQEVLSPQVAIDVSLNPPMACMMQGVCGQCVERLIDPDTGQERLIFTCGAQHQPADQVDWEFLSGRLKRNKLQERLQG